MDWIYPEPVEPSPTVKLPGPIARTLATQQVRLHEVVTPVANYEPVPWDRERTSRRRQFTMTPWAVRQSPRWWW